MIKFTLDRGGVAAILKSGGVAGMVNSAAASVASNVSTPEAAEVVVRSGTTDRATAQVIVAHPKALYWQANDGVLTRAAGAAGLAVRGG